VQRACQRAGYRTYTSFVVYSGREREGPQWIVWAINETGVEYVLRDAHERIGRIGSIVI